MSGLEEGSDVALEIRVVLFPGPLGVPILLAWVQSHRFRSAGLGRRRPEVLSYAPPTSQWIPPLASRSSPSAFSCPGTATKPPLRSPLAKQRRRTSSPPRDCFSGMAGASTARCRYLRKIASSPRSQGSTARLSVEEREGADHRGSARSEEPKGEIMALRQWDPSAAPSSFTSRLSRFLAPSPETTALCRSIVDLYPSHPLLQSLREARCAIYSSGTFDGPLKLDISPSGKYVAYYTGILRRGEKPRLLLGRTTELDGMKAKVPAFGEVEHGLEGQLTSVLIDEEEDSVGLRRVDDERILVRPFSLPRFIRFLDLLSSTD